MPKSLPADTDDDKKRFFRADLRESVRTSMRVWPHARLDIEAVGFPKAPSDSPNKNNQPPPVIDYADLTGNAGIHPDMVAARAVAWIAELGDVVTALVGPLNGREAWNERTALQPLLEAVDRLADDGPKRRAPLPTMVIRLGNTAESNWPKPPSKGQKISGVTIGERGNDTEVCALCNETIGQGRDSTGQILLKRIDGDPYHATSQGNGPGGLSIACYWEVWRQRRKDVA